MEQEKQRKENTWWGIEGAELKKQVENFSVISYMYPIKNLKNKEKVIEGRNKIYIYG